ncbi:MAG: histidine phosphatase family protein [Candidatus Hydrogenedentota bacterium]|jgi:probable phosphoglycerate mutase|uniref:Phosphoglycerate mutase family n=1 Tax=Sumerlaea chitinivorans TaxID=2250252 RepID=A0A2Z4Y4X6_SUMC1|nr:Phosphoglycerate mutase family [Candidatus Sumerlaea chitinivorans]RMH27661.1 MAG: histidine phosphatase family protein [Candidatus Hydrogenedentota bacterium]GIX44030.1 MAG: hypothetical protein KatS3mg130_0438 [Candidatus Sumerlaea sp.]
MKNEFRKCTLYVVRHGQTQWNVQKRWQGWLDSPLTEEGKAQARDAQAALSGIELAAAYASDVGRAIHTAEILLEGCRVPLRLDRRLRERNYGAYEGRTAEELDRLYPNTRYKDVGGSREAWRPPLGEPLSEVRTRVEAALREIVNRHLGENVLVVTHGGVMQVIESICARKSLDELETTVPPNAAIFWIEAWPPDNFLLRDKAFSVVASAKVES